MNISQKLLEELNKQWESMPSGFESLPTFLARELKKLDSIQDEITKVNRDLNILEINYNQQMRVLEKQKSEIHKKCSHIDKEFHQGDRSIGYEDRSICNICGVTVE